MRGLPKTETHGAEHVAGRDWGRGLILCFRPHCLRLSRTLAVLGHLEDPNSTRVLAYLLPLPSPFPPGPASFLQPPLKSPPPSHFTQILDSSLHPSSLHPCSLSPFPRHASLPHPMPTGTVWAPLFPLSVGLRLDVGAGCTRLAPKWGCVLTSHVTVFVFEVCVCICVCETMHPCPPADVECLWATVHTGAPQTCHVVLALVRVCEHAERRVVWRCQVTCVLCSVCRYCVPVSTGVCGY